MCPALFRPSLLGCCATLATLRARAGHTFALRVARSLRYAFTRRPLCARRLQQLQQLRFALRASRSVFASVAIRSPSRFRVPRPFSPFAARVLRNPRHAAGAGGAHVRAAGRPLPSLRLHAPPSVLRFAAVRAVAASLCVYMRRVGFGVLLRRTPLPPRRAAPRPRHSRDRSPRHPLRVSSPAASRRPAAPAPAT